MCGIGPSRLSLEAPKLKSNIAKKHLTIYLQQVNRHQRVGEPSATSCSSPKCLEERRFQERRIVIEKTSLIYT